MRGRALGVCCGAVLVVSTIVVVSRAQAQDEASIALSIRGDGWSVAVGSRRCP